MIAMTLIPSTSNANNTNADVQHGTYVCSEWMEGYVPATGRYGGVTVKGTMSIATVTKGKIVLSRTMYSNEEVTLTQIGQIEFIGSADWFAILQKENTKHEMYSVHNAKRDLFPQYGCDKYDLCILAHRFWGGFDLTKCTMQ